MVDVIFNGNFYYIDGLYKQIFWLYALRHQL